MRNKHPGTCYRCNTRVEAGDGHFEKNRGAGPKWRTQHASCAIRWRGATRPPTVLEAQAAREAHLAAQARGKRA